MTDPVVAPTVPVPMPAAASSPNVLHWVGLLLLGLSLGSNAYLWHLWREDQAVAQAVAQPSPELQALQIQVQDLQRLKAMVDQWSSDLESLKKAAGNGRIEMETLKAEMKRLQDSRTTYEALVQKQLQTYQEQWTKQIQSQKRHEVNW